MLKYQIALSLLNTHIYVFIQKWGKNITDISFYILAMYARMPLQIY